MSTQHQHWCGINPVATCKLLQNFFCSLLSFLVLILYTRTFSILLYSWKKIVSVFSFLIPPTALLTKKQNVVLGDNESEWNGIRKKNGKKLKSVTAFHASICVYLQLLPPVQVKTRCLIDVIARHVCCFITKISDVLKDSFIFISMILKEG